MKSNTSCILNKKEQYSQVPRPTDTRYTAKGTKGKWSILRDQREMKICEQQSEIVMRHLPVFSIYGYAKRD